MKKFVPAASVWLVFLLATSLWHPARAQAAASNRPPDVSVLWPQPGDAFSAGILIRIKADASDSDGSIVQVQFFAETNLIGAVTNQPFNLLWPVIVPGLSFGKFNLKAVAV